MGTQLEKAGVGPTSGPTWGISHLRVEADIWLVDLHHLVAIEARKVRLADARGQVVRAIALVPRDVEVGEPGQRVGLGLVHPLDE